MFGLTFIRERNYLSLQDLSQKMGISIQNINQWERGKRPIPEKRLIQLEELLKVPKEYINKDLTEIEKFDVRLILLKNEGSEITGVRVTKQLNEKSGEYELTPEVLYADNTLNIKQLKTKKDKLFKRFDEFLGDDDYIRIQRYTVILESLLDFYEKVPSNEHNIIGHLLDAASHHYKVNNHRTYSEGDEIIAEVENVLKKYL